ncbi:polyprenyl synthetase family protein [Nocardia arthritidis]|uniref:Polyprenyl synthetase family protein n=1 Tax=Nocardia arthritidis TaxID=228602 RepID=A0A6G9YD69_9NOCA|nr:polyprenyl synthetase family protein [Nocardia arthritidis]QIS11225.1 polyprenyl synthetase family protein [Nocardia arthritidis]
MTTATSSGPQHRPAELLARARTILEPVLRESVGALPEPLRRMAGYHFGWWDARGAATNADSGKALRPALAIAAATACGALPTAATPAAAAVELVHNFTLVHDDVMDADENRRGRPAVWKVWGTTNAVLVGDALHALAGQVLAQQLPAALAAAAIDRLERTVVELCRGQYLDCCSKTDWDISDCERMALGKTGALMGCACAMGALCAGAGDSVIAALDRFGRNLGLAFQFIDDLIGIWGDPEVSGKPTNDLAHHKLSLPVVAALRSGTPAARELANLYRSEKSLSAPDIARAAALIELAGGRQLTRRVADERVAAAIAALPDRSAAADLIALAYLVAHRCA